MTLPRLIPCLLLRERGLWKSRRFRDWTYVGDAVNAIKIFNEKEVDELVLFDVDASKSGRAPDWEYIEECASECFMPLGYGGGIRSRDDAEKLVSLGVEKVILNTAAWTSPDLIGDVAAAVGSCSTVVCLDVKKTWRRALRRYEHASKSAARESVLDAAVRVVDAGAGEVILQDVDRDGMFTGPDYELLEAVASAVPVPVTVAGGFSGLEEASEAWARGVSGVAAGSWFVFQRPHRAVLISYPAYADIRQAWERSQPE